MKAMGKLSAVEKEKTKIRERNRRSITTKIFQGLRKYGGYNLAPRADINEVLRCLAAEAGWIVEEDGTTYRAQSHPSCSAQVIRHATSSAGAAAGRTSYTSGGSSLQAAGMSMLYGSVSGPHGSILGPSGAGTASVISPMPSGCATPLLQIGAPPPLSATGGGMSNMLQTNSSSMFCLQPLDVVGNLVDARGGDCSTTASPRHQPAAATTTNTSAASYYSVPGHQNHHANHMGGASQNQTPTSSISFMPSAHASPFASPASSEVYPSSSRSINPIPLAPSNSLYVQPQPPSQQHQHIQSIANNGFYLPSATVGEDEPSPADIKDELLQALPLDFGGGGGSSSLQDQHQNLLYAAATMAARSQVNDQLLYLGPSYRQEQDRSSAVTSLFHNTSRLSGSAGRIGGISSISPFIMMQPYLQESRASNHNTPLGSPQHH